MNERTWTWDQATRKGEAWTPEEDRKLLARLHELDGDPRRFETLAREHSRTECAITTRIASLKAGIRLVGITR